MSLLRELYRPSLALLTDLYQATMAYGYWKAGMAEREAVFHLSFRKNPFNGGYTIAAGLGYAVKYLSSCIPVLRKFKRRLMPWRRPKSVLPGICSPI